MARRNQTPRRVGAQRRGGFTLMEMLAAMSLFAIVATGSGVMTLQSMRQLAANRHAQHAAMLAQEELEYQRGVAYGDLASRSRTTTMFGQSYTVATTMLADTPAANMTQISVSVSWTGPEGSKSYAVQTIFTAVIG